MDDVGLVETVLDLTGLGLLDGLRQVGGHGAGLGGGHETLGAEDLTETADNAHHVGAGDDDVEIEPVLALDLLDELHAADVIRAGFLALLFALRLAEHENLDALAGAVGQDDGAADLLVSVAGVNAELHMQLDGLVELRLGGLGDKLESLSGLILGAFIDELRALFIIFTSEHFIILLKCGFSEGYFLPRLPAQSPTTTPMERQVPAIMLTADSMSEQLRSRIFCSAILRTSSLLMVATLSR